jgi:ligand-binding sensor domain-containing protein
MKKTLAIFLLTFLTIWVGCKDDDKETPKAIPGNIVNAIYITDDGLRYFATDKGLASFDGTDWAVYHDNPKIHNGLIHDLDLEQTTNGPEFWMGTNKGINVVGLPIYPTSGATFYNETNTQELFSGQATIKGDSVFAIRVDGKQIRWFGTDKGLSAFSGNKWPSIDLNGHYTADFFIDNKITSIDFGNDTIYIGTMGGGVARIVANGPDAISGASPYEIPWSTIPSANITSVFVDGHSQWFGSDNGISRHDGTEAKDNWNYINVTHGLVHKYVQAISKDNDGNMWFATRGGLSKYNGTAFTNYTVAQGLPSDNVLCIAIDKDGSIWFGTDKGASHFNGSTFTNYKSNE